MRAPAALAIFFLSLVCDRALGEDPPLEEESTVVVETDKSSDTESSSHVASEINPEPLVGSGRSIADAVEVLPGIHLRRFGGMGGLTSIVIRGLGMNYVNLVVDNIPIMQTGVGGIDLNFLPLSHIERIEVYRGGGPIELESPIGGVVRIVTRIPKKTHEFEAHLGGGTEWSRSSHIGLSGPVHNNISYHFLLHYFGTKGDFNYLNDNNTPYNPQDDFKTTRRQNASDVISGRLAIQGEGIHKSLWSISAMANWKESQVPGPHLQMGHLPPDANATDTGFLVNAEIREMSNVSRTLEGNMYLSLAQSHRHFESDGALLGFAVNSIESKLKRGDVKVKLTYRPSLSHHWRLAFGIHRETKEQSADVQKDVGVAANFTRQETRPFMGIEIPANLTGSLEIIPRLRLDGQISQSSYKQSTRSVLFSPRLGFVLRQPKWRLRGNIGRYHRFPNSIEQFGDGLRIAPNPDLAPERGFLADLNLSVPVGKQQLELSGFNAHAEGLIAMLPTSQRYIQSYNLRDQRIWGLEAQIVGNYTWLKGTISYTFLRSKSPLGIHTPGIPTHRVDTHLSFFSHGLRLTYQPSYQTQVFLDPDNQLALPPRLIHNASLRFHLKPQHLSISLSAQNISNEQTAEVLLPNKARGVVTQADFLGYPLAGRTLFASLHWKY